MNKYVKGSMWAGLCALTAMGLAACGQNSNSTSGPASGATAAAPASTAAAAPAPASTAAPAAATTAGPMAGGTSAAAAPAGATNWFGGPIYTGEPALSATAALVQAGGGATNFSFAKALVSMLGQKTVNAEVAKLNKQYGEENVKNFISGMDFAVNDALKRATEKGIKLPPPAPLKGEALAKALVQAGTAPDGTFWSGYLFDHALSHDLHNEVMADIDAKASHAADENTHKILNQAMYDVAQALGMKDVKLAPLH